MPDPTDQPDVTRANPLIGLQQAMGADTLHFGPPPDQGGIPIVETFGAYEAEYAAVRQRVGILHQPQRGLVAVTGQDRRDFLHRMVTNDMSGLPAGRVRRTLQLTGKGRILADAVALHEDGRTLLELDHFSAAELIALLDQRLFAEDVQLEDQTAAWQSIALHGPASTALVDRVTDGRFDGLEAMALTRVQIAGAEALVYRLDGLGVLGLHLWVPADHAEAVYRALLDAAGYDPQADQDPDADYAERRRAGLRGRPIGWLAYNTARIEAGLPLFRIDFGPDSLPGELGEAYFDQTTSLTKGCYLGQEIVARMKNLGHPKRVLVGLKLQGETLPVAGAQLFDASESDAAAPESPVGGVTSSTLSPILGHTAIAFAVVKWGKHRPGTTLRVAAEGQLAQATVGPLNFLAQG